MRIQTILLIAITVVSVSCAPSNMQLPIETPLPTLTKQAEINTPTSTPTEVLLEQRRRIQTPINTPHPVPTPLGKLPSQEYFDLHDKRVEQFEDSLQFTIRVLDIFVYSEENNTPYYVVKVEGVLKNVCDRPVVVRKELITGFTMTPEVHWVVSYNGMDLPNYDLCCADGSPDLHQQDFVVLAPGEFQRYSWAIPFELEKEGKQREKFTLSGKTLPIFAIYANGSSGFNLYDEQGGLIPFYIDMNAWVGGIRSNTVDILFP